MDSSYKLIYTLSVEAEPLERGKVEWSFGPTGQRLSHHKLILARSYAVGASMEHGNRDGTDFETWRDVLPLNTQSYGGSADTVYAGK